MPHKNNAFRIALVFLRPGAVALGLMTLAIGFAAQVVTEAPAAFDNKTNGAISQSEYDDNKADFAEVETVADGLGPVFNADSCAGCHLSSGVVGGSSQVQELRAGHNEYLRQYSWHGRFAGRRDQNEHGQGYKAGPTFVPADAELANGSVIEGRSLINQRSICADAQSYTASEDKIVATRLSLSVLGDGFVEAVPDETFRKIAANQAKQTNGRVHGQVIEVPILEADGATAVGRFGWKDQHASLLSFSADAYLNEMGITSSLLPDEVTSVCQSPDVPNPNTEMEDIEHFAAFMRATKAPPRNTAWLAADSVQAGAIFFDQIGCAMCHVSTLKTASAGTVILGGAYSVPDALADKFFHPYSDFLLHDIGTGDGIVQNGGDDTANKLRTMPLWGLATRPQLMHDGTSETYEDAIRRHQGEASDSARRFYLLRPQQKQALYAFMRSL